MAVSPMVEPNFKPGPEPCGCGCGLVGVLRARAWRDGVVCVKRGCSCRRCLGKRSRSKGDDKARRARNALSIPGANTRHEELLGGKSDDSDRVADQHDRYLALIPGERRDVTVRRPRPFGWQRDEEAS